MSLQSGVRLGPYEIVSLAGAGGMGEVYRARDTRLGRSVAIKVIGSGYGNYPEMRRRFDTEARLVAQLDHPRIGALFDVGHDDGIDYVVMEFIEGKTLAERIIQGPLAFAELIGYAIEIAAGLAYAHARGIEHRDLKPGNILLTATGVKIIDFGIGKLRQSDLAWMGRDGRRLGSAAGPAQYVDFQLSPNNRYIAVGQADQHSDRSDLRLIDLLRGSNLRLTTSPATDASPVWSPDGSRLMFRSNRERQHDLYVRPAAGGGADQLFLKSAVAKYPTDWSPDSTFIVYHASQQRTHYDVWAAPVDHPNQSRPLVQTEFDDVQGQVSPTGRWLAYSSNQSSRFEVYVQPLHTDGRTWQVSVGGGSDPKWRADEKEIFYLDGNGRMMSVALSGGTDFDPGVPRPLFRLRDTAVIPPYLSAYDVQGDGERFLVRLSTEEMQTHPLNVVVNWLPTSRAAK